MPLSSDKHIVDDQFKKQLHHYKVQPSAKVWNRLSDALHFEQRKNATGKRLLLVLLLLLAGSGGVWMSSKIQPKGDALIVSNRSADESENVQKNPVSESTTTLEVQQENSKPVRNYIENDIISVESSTSDLITAEENKQKVKEVIENEAVPIVVINDAEQFSPVNLNASSPKYVSEFLVENSMQVPIAWTDEAFDVAPLTLSAPSGLTASSQVISPKKVKHSPSPVVNKNSKYYLADASGLYIGFGENFNSTHIIDKRAFHDENLKYTPTFGTAFMLHGGYNMNNKWGLEVAWVIHSQEGQRYKYLPTDNRTTSLEYNQKHVSFNYMQFPVMARCKVQGWSGITETPIFVNYSVGFQYGRLLSYSVDETKERVSEQNLFRKNEYALVAGVDYDFLSRKAAFYTVGLRASYGSDLFVKDVPEYLEFDRPHNVVIGIHGAVNFSLKKMPRSPATY
jgi:hypothetical protein